MRSLLLLEMYYSCSDSLYRSVTKHSGTTIKFFGRTRTSANILKFQVISFCSII